MSDGPGRSFKLSGKRLELLQALRREQGMAPARAERIPRRPAAESWPLSFSQQRLWFLDRLVPGSAAYNMPLAVRLSGRLRPAALAAALSGVAARQASLRTTFEAAGGEPAQRIAAPARVPLPLVDGTALPPAARAEWLQRRVAELARMPFDLSRGPLLRVVLLRLDDREHREHRDGDHGEHVVVACLHHTVADGWSLEILLRELAVLYAAAAAEPGAPGAAALAGPSATAATSTTSTTAVPSATPAAAPSAGALPELPIQYTDFAAWQREWAERGGLDEQIAYWRRQLAGAPTLLELPADRPRPAVPELRGGVTALTLPAALAGGLQQVARRHDATPFMALLAVLAALLARHGAREDMLIGTLIAGRHRPETEGLIGFFANTLVLRADAAGDPAFGELLGRVREATLGAFAHQDVPFERLVEQLAPERSLRHMPLFQVLLVLQNVAAARPVELPGLTLTPLPAATGLTRLDLGLTAVLWDGGLNLAAEYSAELFDPPTVRRLLLRFATLAAAAAAAPELRLSALSPLPASERHQLLAEWGEGPADLRGEPLLHRLFEAQAAAGPRRVALVHAGERLTYGDLDARAGRLAAGLRAAGVGPESTVGLLLPSGPDMIAAILAVWKAGGAYLPLAADSPPDRLAFVLGDAGVHVVLAAPELAPRLAGCGVLALDPGALGAGGGADPAAAVQEAAGEAGPANLAYVIYTSGSTGRPKGVMVPHSAVSMTLRWRLARFHLAEADCVLQNISYTFDPSIWQIFGALLSGARLVLVAPGGHGDFAGLVRTIAAERVTITDLAPSMLRAFLDQDGLDACQSLRLLFAGGEALPPELAARFAARFPAAELYNIYGPTEAAIDASTFRCAPRPAAAASMPIGRPISGKRLAVLGRDLAPVPVGVAGELFIGGPGLARGYLGRPDLTAERFVPDPFAAGVTSAPGAAAAAAAGARLYRTGDMVRHLADGLLEFLGRVDRQVKVRGFRIELGEIEAALGRHERVCESCALLLPQAGGEPLLAAYFAPDWEGAAAELRERLAAELPAFMVPAALLGMAVLPRTASGKVDRDALPAPGAGAEAEARAARYAAPASALERTLAGIWEELLGRPRVGVDDNFFDLGGHSLLLVRLQARVQQALGREVPLVELFNYPTVGTLAAHLTGGAGRDMAGAGALAAAERADEQIAAFSGARGAAPAAGAAGGALPAIAVVGMAGRFPGAATVDDFWQNLRAGRESIRGFSDGELLAAGVDEALLANPAYVRARGALDGVDLFDAPFFDIAASEAEILDPQHRLFLETVWEGLESAGCDPSRFAGPIGVFAGVSANTYLLWHLMENPAAVAAAGHSQAMLGSDKDFLATRVSYKLNLRGPSLTVQTACSTSLVAVHLACRALLGHECDLAVAGGVSVAVPQVTGYLYQDGGIASPDGHCRAFDAAARGTVGGSGAGVVVLRRLADALAAGDPIRAVIRATSINNDGAAKVGYTAPGVDGQAAAIAAAQRLAGVTPDDISYVEAHGTGTPLGDPIEIAALTKVFRAATARRGFCAIGSVKTNIGHLDAAAGAAGLIKTVLALEHREIPPSLHFTAPNPQIDFAASPFFVNAALAEWATPPGVPRRAAVSSFGMGGTNAHAILEAAPEADAPPRPSRPHQLLVLSARTAGALEAQTDRLAGYLSAHPGVSLADVAHTLQTGRRAMGHRRALVARDGADAAAALTARDPVRLLTLAPERGRRPVVFLFPGQGSQHPGMGRELYAEEPAFRAALDACLEILAPRLPEADLRALLWPAPAAAAGAAARLTETRYAQPLLFAVEYALARLWMEWGAEPAAMLGHSLGEYVAACLAGVFSLEDGLALVAERARLMQELPGGAMLAVPLPEAELRELLAAAGSGAAAGDSGGSGGVGAAAGGAHRMELAAVNAPGLCVVSGPAAAAAAFAAELEARGVAVRRLHTSHAFHSAVMDALTEPFGAALRRIRLSPPRLPYLSNLTGTWIEPAQATDPAYWLAHLRQPVRFAEALRELAEDPARVLLEVGPGRALATLVRRQEGAASALAAVSSLLPSGASGASGGVGGVGGVGGGGGDEEAVLTALGRLWLAGVEIAWDGFARHESRRKLPLPTYPFERRRYWLAAAPAGRAAGGAGALAERSAGRQPREDWFWAPVWRQSAVPRRNVPAGIEAATGGGGAAAAGAPAGGGSEGEGSGAAATGEAEHAVAAAVTPPAGRRGWLLFDDGHGLLDGVASRLRRAGEAVVTVAAGGEFAAAGGGRYALHPGRRGDYVRLFSELAAADALPERIVHAWSVTRETAPGGSAEALPRPGAPGDRATLTRGFTSLILLAQAMAEVAGRGAGAPGDAGEAAAPPPRVELTAVANGLWSVTGDEPIHPEKATLLGPVRVIPLEYGVRCRAVDVVLPASAAALDRLAGELLAELAGAEGARLAAQATAEATPPAQTMAPAEGPFEPAVALRAGRRWVRRFDRLPAPAGVVPPGAGGRLRRGGVVLVTGGLGGVGFTLARHLFETAAARLVLLTHTALPPRREWDAALADGGVPGAVSDAVRRRIERIRELEGLGAEVLVAEADVADGTAMAKAVEQARARFGAVHGVVHAAGVPSGRLIRHAGEEQAMAVLSPKLHGALVLERLLPAAELDLCVHCSSLAAILGGVGQVDYCAANAFLDAQAAAAAAAGARGALSIAWDAWREVGMRAGEAGGPAGAAREPRLGLLPAEGVWAFDRAVASGLPEVAVSTLDLRRLIAEMRAAPAAEETAAAAAPAGPAAAGAGQAHPRPQLPTAYAAPRNETEAALASIWEEVLGIAPIGIHDDFSELGGHSLLALQVLSRVRGALAADLPLRAVFDAPNVAALSLKVLEGAAAAADEAALEQMLAGLEGLSDAEAEALLGAEQVPQAADGKAPGEPR